MAQRLETDRSEGQGDAHPFLGFVCKRWGRGRSLGLGVWIILANSGQEEWPLVA